MGARESMPPVIIAFLVLNGIVIALRTFVRIDRKTFSHDDAILLVAFVTFIIFCAFELVAIYYGIGATDAEPRFNATLATKYFVIAQLLYLIAQCIVKISVAMVLFRIASPTSRTRKFILASVATHLVYSKTVTVIFGLHCQPLSVAWGEGTGSCMSGAAIANTSHAISAKEIAYNWLYALLPVHMLWGIQLSIRTKAAIFVLLGMGVLSCIATIVRLKYLIQYSAEDLTASAGAIEIALTATVYSVIDVGLAVFAASLTALKPLLSSIPFFGSPTRGTGAAKSGSGFGAAFDEE